MDIKIDGVQLTPLKIIEGQSGSIMHIMRNDSPYFHGFGEVYISTIKQGQRKGWKKHTKMVLNIVVPVGAIRFVFFDDRMNSLSRSSFDSIELSPANYYRLTVPSNIWMAFEGKASGESMLINFANIIHDPDEAETQDIDSNIISYDWK